MYKLLYRNAFSLSRNIRPAYAFAKPSISNTILQETRRGVTEIAKKPILQESKQLKTKILNFLYENKQRPIPTADKNVILTNCPHCYKTRKNSFAAYLDLQKATYNCKSCKAKGSFSEFSRTLKKKSLVGEGEGYSVLSTNDLLSGKGSESGLSRTKQDIDDYADALLTNSELLSEFETQHKITKDTLAVFGVGTAKVDDKLCLTLPQTTLLYEEDEFKIETVRLKLCEKDDMSQVVELDPPVSGKESTSGFFGYQTASEKDTVVILTGRELDAMVAYQETGIPSFSIPSRYQLQESVLPLLERFNKVYIWLDDDVDGRIAAERFSKKIGEYKCALVKTRQGEQLGPINAYEALAESKDLKSIVSSAKEIKHDQIVDFNDLREDIYNEILHPEQTKGVQSHDLPGLNEIIKGHRPGELTILTGPTGAGKTTIISQLSLDFCKSGVPTLWGSFEILNKRLAKKMLYQFAEKDLSLAPEEFNEIASRFEQLPLYFLKFFSSTAIKEVLKACHHAVYAYDVRHIVLDNLQFMLSQQSGNGMDKWDLQDNAIAEIRRFATEQDVHITLVVHPRKDSSQHEELDIHSIFGSAKVTQEADNVIIIQKTRSDYRALDIKKNRFDGTLGSLPYKFDRNTYKIRELTEEDRKKKTESERHRAPYTSTSVVRQRKH